MQCGAVELIRCPAHGDLAQRGQIFRCEKMAQRPFCLTLPVYFPLLQTLDQRFRFNVHQFNLIGTVKYMVRNAFVYHHPCD